MWRLLLGAKLFALLGEIEGLAACSDTRGLCSNYFLTQNHLNCGNSTSTRDNTLSILHSSKVTNRNQPQMMQSLFTVIMLRDCVCVKLVEQKNIHSALKYSKYIIKMVETIVFASKSKPFWAKTWFVQKLITRNIITCFRRSLRTQQKVSF